MRAFDAAAESFERVAELGRELWSTGEHAAYARQDGDTAQLTITTPGRPNLVYRLIGIDEGDL